MDLASSLAFGGRIIDGMSLHGYRKGTRLLEKLHIWTGGEGCEDELVQNFSRNPWTNRVRL